LFKPKKVAIGFILVLSLEGLTGGLIGGGLSPGLLPLNHSQIEIVQSLISSPK